MFDKAGNVIHERGVTESAGFVLHRLALAVHARLGPDRVCQGRRRVPGGADSRPPRARSRPECNENEDSMSTTDRFPTDTEGLQEATPSATVELADGKSSTFASRRNQAARRSRVRMLAYNGSIPGPTLRVKQGSEWSSTPRTRAIWRRRSIGTACGSRTVDGTPRHNADSRRRELPARVIPGPRRLLVPPAHPRGLRPGDGPVRQLVVVPADPDYWAPATAS